MKKSFSNLFSSIKVAEKFSQLTSEMKTPQKIFLGILLSYLIIGPLYAMLVDDPERVNFLKCPDRYAYEDSPGVYIRCEDWEVFVKLYEGKKSYKHLVLKGVENGK